MIDPDKIALQIAERLRDLGTKQGRIPFDTGDLRKSIQVEHTGKGRATVGSNLVYARPVHDGRPAITIKPKKKKALAFKVGGQTVFATSVHQPARKGKPFLKEAAIEMQHEGYGFISPEVEKQAGEELAKVLPEKIKLDLKF